MGSLTRALVEFLGSKGATILSTIPDSQDRSKIIEAMILCAASLNEVDAINLTEFELAESPVPTDRIWSAVREPVDAVEMSINMTANALLEMFGGPSPEEERVPSDENVDFAISDDIEGYGAVDSFVVARGGLMREAESLVEGASVDRRDEIGRDVAALAGMLKTDLDSMVRRLRDSGMHLDSWTLLTEVAELKAMCVQSIEAMAAAVLKSHSSDELSIVLPRYVSATMRSVLLRSLLTELEAEFDRTNESLRAAPDRILEAWARDCLQRLDRFVAEPAYTYMRPVDRRGVIQFRMFLRTWVGAPSNASDLRREVEGFSKLLHITRRMNDGRELVRHDREALRTAEMLLEGGGEWMDAMPYLEIVYGRSVELDGVIRACRVSDPPVKELLLALIKDAAASF